MASSYLLKVTQAFSAAHVIPGHPGKCGRLHGHNWTVDLEVKASKLGPLGMAVDFYDMKRALAELIGIVDHRHLNELSPFDKIPPTAENISAWFFQQLSAQINTADYKVAAVCVWETDGCSVRYSEND